MLSDEQRSSTLERFERHRRAWQENPCLRPLYREWYGRVRAHLPPRDRGPWVELGSGPGFAREFIPELQLSDLVRAPWHDHEMSAERLTMRDGSVGALVLFDVLHHLSHPSAFFDEAVRVLVPGGRVVLCEPYLTPLSYLAYRLFHEEDVKLRVNPLAVQGSDQKHPFESNQAIPTLMFGRFRQAFAGRFPQLGVVAIERFAGPSYAVSGGFGRRPLVPLAVWRALYGVERKLPPWVFRLLGFRMLIVVEKRPH